MTPMSRRFGAQTCPPLGWALWAGRLHKGKASVHVLQCTSRQVWRLLHVESRTLRLRRPTSLTW